MKVVLIPCAASEWTDAGRLLGRVELEMTAEGRRAAEAWHDELVRLGVTRVYHSTDDLATSTARLLAKKLGATVKPVDDFADADLGLWSGVTEAQLESRFDTAYHQLLEAPMTVIPPNGEALAGAAERIRKALSRRLKASTAPAVGLVLRPIALAMARCILENAPWTEMWPSTRFRRPQVIGERPPPPAGAPNGTAARGNASPAANGQEK